MSKAEKLAQQILDYSTVVARAARGQTEPPPGWSGDIKADIARLLEPHLVGEWMPWKLGLGDWDIVGMNHYHVDGERRLFAAMTNGFECIRAEGADEAEVFAVLRLAAEAHDAAPPKGEQSA